MSGSVRFVRWRVSNVGVFGEKAVEIGPLSPGVNVIAGPNECGKSTMVRALRTALFERYGLVGKKTSPLQPHGTRLAPRVELDFDVDGVAYHLEKQLLVKPSARLTVGGSGHVLEDEDVDERLREVFHTHKGNKQGVSTDDMGLFGLLWVEQDDFARREPAEALGPRVKGDLATAIEHQVGKVIGGSEGVNLRDAIEQTYAKFFTAGQEKVTGELAALERKVAELEAEAKTREESLGETVRLGALIRDDDERLTELTEREASLAEQLAEDEAELRASLEAADALAHARAAAKRADDDLTAARASSERRRSRREELATVQAEVAQRAVSLRALRDDEGRRRAALDAARSKHESRAEAGASLQRRLQVATANVERLQLDAQVTELTRALDDARRIEAAIREADGAMRGGVDDAHLAAIEQLDAQCQQRREAAQHQATRVTVARPGGELRVEPITRPMEVDLGPLGRIEVEPPRAGFLALRRQWRETAAELREALARLHATSAREVRERADADARRQEALTAHQEALHAAAPKGVDALAAEAATAERQHREAADALERARAAQEKVELLDAEVAMVKVAPEVIEPLRQAQARIDVLRATPDAAGVQVRVRAISEGRVQVGTRAPPQVLSAEQTFSRRVVERLVITVDERIEIEIDPGSLPAPALERARLEADVARRLEALGLATVAELESRARSGQNMEVTRNVHRAELKKLCPNGVADLISLADASHRRAQELAQRLVEAQKAAAAVAAHATGASVTVSRAACEAVDALDRRAHDLELETRRAAGRLVKVEGALAGEWTRGAELLDELGALVDGARVTLIPGESDDVELPVIEGRLRHELTRAGASSVREARQLRQRHAELAASRVSYQRELARVAPSGAAALEVSLAEAIARRERLPEDATQGEPSAHWIAARDALRRDEADAAPELRVARELLEKRDAEHRSAADALREAEGAQRDREAQARTLAASLDSDRAADGDNTLDDALTRTTAARDETSRSAAELETRVERMDPTRREAAAAQSRRALEAARAQRLSAREARLRREGELEQMRREGRFERLDACQGELDELRPKLTAARDEAAAVKLLRKLTQECYASAESELMEPVYRELGKLLPMLWEDGRVRLDKDWQVKSVDRRGVSESFEALSGGAREQLALIVRIALAKVLIRDRVALPMVLDDILGWTDDRRFKQMAQVIERAARDMQVIVLTCHPARFARMVGAAQFTVEPR